MTDNAGTCVPPPLYQLSAQQTLALFLDFDGTLVDIADHPDAVIVGPNLTDHLHRLDDGLAGRLAIITGRPLGALDAFLGPNHIKAVGSHEELYVTCPDYRTMVDLQKLDDGETESQKEVAVHA